jgi:GTP diphosphokinase / guanosine-3',5'-bis(diphosphate) 3'-diphosphatase
MAIISVMTDSQSKYKVAIPSWLNQCLISESENEDNNLICRAFQFAYSLHEGQTRKSGEAYIAHPIAVAGLLRDLGGDSEMIAAGFLHDVVEDVEEISAEDIEEKFGSNVRKIVEAVTKLSKFNFSNKTERQAENFRRMFIAMAQDIRVIVVKLADRLHNMRTLDFLPPEKQYAIAEETKEIFAPLANRLGIWHFKWELEDLCFKYMHPEDYKMIKSLVSERRKDREQRIQTVIDTLTLRLQEQNIAFVELKGRPKHLYGIYQKMSRQDKKFDQIYDIAAVRIIVKNIPDCYHALSVVHEQFRHIPRRFKDYISTKKPNGYQSLHTTVANTNGRPLEIQIRTEEMHHIAEYGIAAHWKYKEAGNSNSNLSTADEKFTWLRQLLDCQKDLQDAEEYVNNLKENLFDDDVYVFTPTGDVFSLAAGATPVDFAYRIHSEVGNHIKGANINGKWSPLGQPLVNGDMVEIITSKSSHPSLDWLNFVVTPTARNRIRQWYKRSHREENIARGRELLEKEYGKNGLESLLKSETMNNVAQKCNFQKVDDLLVGLGYGEITCMQVLNRLREETKQSSQKSDSLNEIKETDLTLNKHQKVINSKSPIIGLEGLMYHIAGCCKPLPGESIIGVVTNTRGISIHHHDCHNLTTIPGERLIPVSWNESQKESNGKNSDSTYPVEIMIDALDRKGILRDILGRLSDQKINVSAANVKTSRETPALISLTIDVKSFQQLKSTMNKIKDMSDVLNIRRVSEI